ncbi:MAG TPA: hypothetical protein VLT36_18235 [Candidatus Dormibacteraeota bacterium]|nr:hypothetical protein [Candidatus Dormibacteraeota bacterium]
MTAAGTPKRKWRFRKPNKREARLLLYLAVLLGFAAWKFVPRPWHPPIHLETAHHIIHSSATREQTEATAHALNLLFDAYSNVLGSVIPAQPINKLQVRLFKDRVEFRRVNPGLGWAEAFYKKPYCRAYFSAEEVNPYHWMLHESVHQLNEELAHLSLEKWLEEGTADYFATSTLLSNNLAVGKIDLNTYPVWWLVELATSDDLSENIRNGSVIPLRQIITNRGGPRMNSHFNLYYLHWWALTHFVFEGAHREYAVALVKRGGGLPAFEETIGPVDKIQTEWHVYVQRLKKTLAGAPTKKTQSTNALLASTL